QASHARGPKQCTARTGRLASAAAACVMLVAVPVRVDAATARRGAAPAATQEAASEPSIAEQAEAVPGAAYRDPQRRKWSRCRDDDDACDRPGPARLLLLSLGAIAGAAAAGLLFALGDRHAIGDPATLLVGTGAVAGAGALVGMLAGALGGDGAALPDRVRPSTAELSWTWAQ